MNIPRVFAGLVAIFLLSIIYVNIDPILQNLFSHFAGDRPELLTAYLAAFRGGYIILTIGSMIYIILGGRNKDVPTVYYTYP